MVQQPIECNQRNDAGSFGRSLQLRLEIMTNIYYIYVDKIWCELKVQNSTFFLLYCISQAETNKSKNINTYLNS